MRQAHAKQMSRRGVLRILGAAVGMPLAVLGAVQGASALRARPAAVTWSGTALGAEAQVVLWHPRPSQATALLARIEAELARLGRIFDLHDPASEIAQLNATGRLARASVDLRAVLALGLQMAERSGGAFDPTVQPLWRARHAGAGPAQLVAARALVDWRGVDLPGQGVALARAGMQITLNGIAQGHAADRVAMILRDGGLDEALIDAGEVRALGAGPDGRGHRVSLIDPADPRRLQPGPGLRLSGTALAVSGGYGLRLPGGGHHILDPRTGASAEAVIEAVVTHPKAAVADALSTALYASGPAGAAALMADFPQAQARLTAATGGHQWLGQGAAAALAARQV